MLIELLNIGVQTKLFFNYQFQLIDISKTLVFKYKICQIYDK